MEDEKAASWPRKDLGNDPDVWTWAMEKLEGNVTVHLATSDESGPHVRPVTAVMHGGEVYVLTGTKDAKSEHLSRDPRYEILRLVEEGERVGYVRYRGRVVTEDDPDLRRTLCDVSGFAEYYFKGPDDPNLTVLRLGIEKAEIIRPGENAYELLSR